MRSPRKHGDELDDPHANVLHHFTNIESLALILGTVSLRMGPLGFTNDPREFGPWIPEYSANIEEGYEDCPSVEELLQGLIREGNEIVTAVCGPYSFALRGRWLRRNCPFRRSLRSGRTTRRNTREYALLLTGRGLWRAP